MWRFILFIGVLSAVGTVLWSSWRVDKRLFAAVSVGLVIFAIVFGFGAWQGSQQALIEVHDAKLEFDLKSTRSLETGTRLVGVLTNKGTEPVAVINLQVSQHLCNDEGACQEVEQATIVIRRHINGHSSADINEIVRLKSLDLDPKHHMEWRTNITDVQGYRQAKGQSGL